MPKWDKTRNYYADLDLPPSASVDDIKKQHRKLVLQWHPDRNRGNEKQAAIRFQNVQSAYEILTDDTLRREYDIARGTLRSRYPTASGVRGNPYQDIGKQYPRPPTRHPPQANTHSRPSGAQRYATDFGGSMPRPSSYAPPPSANYTAWQSMRENHSTRSRGNPSTTPGRAPTSAARDSRQEPPKRPEPTTFPPRTASQRQKAEAAFGARKSGYVPHSPDLGDEPPVTSKNYYTTRVRTNIFGQTTAEPQKEEPEPEPEPKPEPKPQPEPQHKSQPQPQPQPSSTIPDPLAKFRETYLDGRQSAPYHSSSGEKTSLYDGGPGLGRTTSTRTPPRKTEMPGTFPRPRSSSTPKTPVDDPASDAASTTANVGARNGFPEPASTKFDTSTGGSDSAGAYKYYHGFQTDASKGHKPKLHSQSKNYARSFVPSQSATADPQPPQNDGQPSAYETLPRRFHTTPEQPARHPSGQAYSRWNGAPEQNWPLPGSGQHSDDLSSDRSPLSPGLMPFEIYQKRQVEGLLSRRHTQSRSKEKCVTERRKRFNTPTPTSENDSTAFTNFSRPFSSNARADSSAQHPTGGTSRLAKNSTENINTNFVQGEQTGGWRFTAGSPVGNESTTSPAQSPSAARSMRRPTTRVRPVTTNSVPTQQSMPKDTGNQPFSAGEWSEKIGSEHFVPPPSTSSSTSPTRRPTSKKTKPPNTKPTAGTAGMVDTDENEGWQEIPPSQYNAPPVSTDSPTAMDIDSPPPETTDNAPKEAQAPQQQPSKTHNARNIPVEPTRPDWRAGNVDPVPPRTGGPTLDANHTANPFAGTSTPWAPAPTSVNPFAPHNGGSEDIDDLRANFADLKKTEPFKDPVPAGLKSFADMKSTLPFESRPSEHIPIEKTNTFRPLEFPIPPVGPRPPNAATKSARPSGSDYRRYTEDFANYIDKWENFYAKVTQHLATRQQNSSFRCQKYGSGWLHNSGDGPTVDEYRIELGQDQDVLRKFTDAHAAHAERVREYAELKARMK